MFFVELMGQLTFFYDNHGQVWSPARSHKANVLNIFVAPMSSCLADITAEEHADKAKSLGGLECCFRPEDPLFAHTMVCRTLPVAQPCLSTHGWSNVGTPPRCTAGLTQQRQG